jgi:hypothetical protein
MTSAMEKIRDLQTCGFDKIGEIVCHNKDISIAILHLETKVAYSLIKSYEEKISGKFEVVEPKLFLLNEGKLRIHQSAVEAFEICRKNYIQIKCKFDAVMQSEQVQEVQQVESMWVYKQMIENQQAAVRELKNLYMETKIMT